MSARFEPGVDYTGVTTPFYCNDGKGHFVLHKRSPKSRDENGMWDFGAGQLGFREELEESVLREVKEEFGCKGKIQEQLPPHAIIRHHKGKITHWIAVPFFIKVDLKKVKIMEPDKFEEIGIFTLDKLPKPLHSGVQYTMKKYKKYFDTYRFKN